MKGSIGAMREGPAALGESAEARKGMEAAMTGDFSATDAVQRYIRAKDPPASSYAHSEYCNVRALLIAYRIETRLAMGDGSIETLDRMIEEEDNRIRAKGSGISTSMLAKARNQMLATRTKGV